VAILKHCRQLIVIARRHEKAHLLRLADTVRFRDNFARLHRADERTAQDALQSYA